MSDKKECDLSKPQVDCENCQKELSVFMCGKRCAHSWDGPGVEGERDDGGGFSSVTCSKCGIAAIDACMLEGP